MGCPLAQSEGRAWRTDDDRSASIRYKLLDGAVCDGNFGGKLDRIGLPEEAFLFLMLASYDGRKNQLATLTAFDRVARSHPGARFWFAGNVVDERYFERVKAHREELKTGDRIQLYEFREDIGRLLAAADAFVLNSFFEGWSLAATEALMLGVPLIHSDCGSGRELIGSQGERGILVPNPGSDPIDLTWQTVNLTMGLPFIRTSPDHGTAYDIARTGKADASGMARAIEVALKLI